MSETWKEKVDAAYDMVHALCQPRGSEGSREWIMSIPARPDYDPDLVITSGLRAAANEINTLAAERDELQRRLEEVVVKISEAVVSDDDCVCSMLCHSAITAIAEGRDNG